MGNNVPSDPTGELASNYTCNVSKLVCIETHFDRWMGLMARSP